MFIIVKEKLTSCELGKGMMESRELLTLLQARRVELIEMLGPKKGLDKPEVLKEDEAEKSARQMVNDIASLQIQEISRSLRQVDEALDRLNRGEGGICIAKDLNGSSCGEEISDARLRAKPEAALCIHCAEKAAEKKNPGLGRLRAKGRPGGAPRRR